MFITRLPGQPKEINSPQTDNWIKPSNKRGRSTQDGTNKETKHDKQSECWLNPTHTSNHYIALQEEENEEQQSTSKENIPNPPPPIYI
jgi:hypothetical protein